MLEERFGKLGNFIKRRYKVIIIIWIIALVVLLPFTAKFTSVTDYNVEMTGTSGNSMSTEAQNLLNNQFNNSSNSSNGTAVVLYVNSPFYSHSSYSVWNAINSTYENKLGAIGVTGVVSPYTIANGVVDSVSNATYTLYGQIYNASNITVSSYQTFNDSVSALVNLVNQLKIIDSYYNSTYYNISTAVDGYSTLFVSYESTVENVSSLLYGIPLEFFGLYLELQNSTSAMENLTSNTSDFGGNTSAQYYFNLFYNAWIGSMNSNGTISPYERLNYSIEQAFSEFNSSLGVNESWIFGQIFAGFNVSSYSNNNSRMNITLDLVYTLTSQYGQPDTSLFNASFDNFVVGGNNTLLSENLTGIMLNQSDPLISQFTLQTFNETPEQFSHFFTSGYEINDSFMLLQLNHSVLLPSMEELYQSIDMPSSAFFSGLFSNNSTMFSEYFVSFTAQNIEPLSSYIGQNSTDMVYYFLSRGAESSSLYYSESFLKGHFSGYPYFYFMNPGEFVNSSVSANGSVSSVVNGNYTESGIYMNASLFSTLVPNTFSGFMIILTFSEKSLNGSQLDTLTSYITGIQNEFDPIHIYSTSADEIAHGIESTAYNGLIYSLIVGMIVSIIIVGVYFRSFILAFVPLLFFAISFSIAIGIVYLIFGIIYKMTLSFIVTTLSSILILGLSTDYSVYMLNRYMKDNSEDKLGTTVKWAGHAVFTSGITVIISYVVLALFNIPIIGDGGFVNALGIAISLGVALTLLPSFMYLFKKRIKPKKTVVNFDGIARISRKHRKVLVAVLIVIFVATIVVYETTPTSFDLFSLIPNNEGKVGYYEMASAYGADVLSQNYVLLSFPNQVYSNGSFNKLDLGIINNVSATLLKYEGVSQISTVTYPFGKQVSLTNMSEGTLANNTILNQSISFIGKGGEVVLISVSSKYVSFSQDGINAISHVDSELKKVVPSSVQYLVGGPSQGLLDSSNSISASTYKIVEILAIIVFMVLAFQLTSIFTPLRLLFNVGTSALLAVALFYAVFHYIMNLPIIVFGPLFVIVTLFGVGLDYDIFLVTRTREAVMKGKSDEDAIAEAINENASVILVLGFILSGVFGSLIFSPIGIISEIGFSVTTGVLIDTVVSWLFLIPALMLVLKKLNWWPSHIRPKE